MSTVCAAACTISNKLKMKLNLVQGLKSGLQREKKYSMVKNLAEQVLVLADSTCSARCPGMRQIMWLYRFASSGGGGGGSHANRYCSN